MYFLIYQIIIKDKFYLVIIALLILSIFIGLYRILKHFINLFERVLDLFLIQLAKYLLEVCDLIFIVNFGS